MVWNKYCEYWSFFSLPRTLVVINRRNRFHTHSVLGLESIRTPISQHYSFQNNISILIGRYRITKAPMQSFILIILFLSTRITQRSLIIEITLMILPILVLMIYMAFRLPNGSRSYPSLSYLHFYKQSIPITILETAIICSLPFFVVFYSDSISIAILQTHSKGRIPRSAVENTVSIHHLFFFLFLCKCHNSSIIGSINSSCTIKCSIIHRCDNSIAIMRTSDFAHSYAIDNNNMDDRKFDTNTFIPFYCSLFHTLLFSVKTRSLFRGICTLWMWNSTNKEHNRVMSKYETDWLTDWSYESQYQSPGCGTDFKPIFRWSNSQI